MANVVKYNHQEFDYYEELGTTTTLDPQAYLTIAKLTAIIRVANGLDRSHKQKFKTRPPQGGSADIHCEHCRGYHTGEGCLSKGLIFEEVFTVCILSLSRKII